MAQVYGNQTAKGERVSQTPGGVFDLLHKKLSRLTEGFWEAVVAGFAGNESTLSVQFLSILSFCGFAALCSVASLSRFPFGVYPVPFALLCSIGNFSMLFCGKEYSARTLSYAVVLGVFLCALFFENGAMLLSFSLFLLFLRRISGGRQLQEGVFWRALFSGCVSLLYTLSASVFAGQSPVFSALFFSGLFAALLTFLFSGVYVHARVQEGEEKKEISVLFVPENFSLSRALSAVAFLSCFLYGLKGVRFLGFSPSLILAVLFSVFALEKFGVFCALLSAPFFGFFAFGEAAAGVLFLCVLTQAVSPFSSRARRLCRSFLCGALFLFCFSSSSSAFALCGADLLVSHVLSFFLPRKVRKTEKEERVGALALRTLPGLQEKLSRLSRAFSSLSEVFYMATDSRLTPEGTLCEKLVRQASERVCARCSHSTDCWEQNYGLTHSALVRLGAVLAQKREVASEDLEPYFRSRCRKADALCREIGRLFEKERQSKDPANSPAALLCGEYASVARLLSGEAESLRLEEELSAKQSLLCEKVLKKLNIPHRTAYVSGARETVVTVTGVPLSTLRFSTRDLLKEMEETLGMRFSDPEFEPPLEDATLTLRRRRAVSLSCARLSCPAGSQTVCGDTTGFFESDCGFFYSLICDGMGSGRQAAFTSRLSSIFIEKLLTFSREKGVTLEMLNRFLLAQKQERFSTVDLLEIDFYSGRANFIKAGAAASYVKRKTGLYRISSKTPPAGILGEISAEQTTLTLAEGDSIVMFSDGISPGEESDAWFAETLAFAKEADARALAEHLMQASRKHHAQCADDMSVCVLEVHAA